MRIAILTLPLHTNYGGILQAYALQTVLERMGHEVCLVEKRRKPVTLPLWKAPLVYGKRILKNVSGHSFPILYEQKVNREEPVVRQHTDKFIDQYIKRRIAGDFSEIKKSDYDAFVVGSDQIWRPMYFNDRIERAYLDFTEGWGVRRVAYAASFGTDEWEYTPKQTERCGALLRRFDAVSVRESSAVDLCREHFGVEAQHVLDPTMLLAKEDYVRLFENAKTPKSNGTLLNYILDDTPEKTALVNKIAGERHLVPFMVNSKVEDKTVPLADRIQPPLEQWLRGFHDAEFVVTDSFHACVFSILFNKPFIAIGNVNRGLSRFNSLLGTFGLEDRLMEPSSNVNACLDFDWMSINSKLDAKREDAKSFLVNNLIDANGK